MAKVIFGANLKMMNPLPDEKNSFSELEHLLRDYEKLKITSNQDAEIIVFAPYTHLDHIKSNLMPHLGIEFSLGAQEVSEYNSGAHTSEISPIWLKELGVKYVLVGHSEVRSGYEEIALGSKPIPEQEITKPHYKNIQKRINSRLNHKIKNSLFHGLNVVYCVGETENERKLGITQEIIDCQMKFGLSYLNQEEKKRLTISYEPRWAIGTGKIPTIPEIKSVHEIIRNIAELIGEINPEELQVIYGGSMNPGNVKEIMGISGVNGGLVGTACLKAEDFKKIVNYKKS